MSSTSCYVVEENPLAATMPPTKRQTMVPSSSAYSKNFILEDCDCTFSKRRTRQARRGNQQYIILYATKSMTVMLMTFLCLCHFTDAFLIPQISSSSSITAVGATTEGKGNDSGSLKRPRGRAIKRNTSSTVQNSIGDRPAPRTSILTANKAGDQKQTKYASPPTRNYGLMDHEILSKKEEQRLGRQLRRAIILQQKVNQLQDIKELEQLERVQEYRINTKNIGDSEFDDDDDDLSLSLEDELEEFLMKNRRGESSKRSGHYIKDYGYEFDEIDDEEELGLSLYGIDRVDTLERFDSRSVASQGSKSLDILDITLTDQEIIDELDVKGGRQELTQILVDGARAKEKMIQSNIRLVMNISKKWFALSSSAGDADNSNKKYIGSWTRPSLDEVMQEGIIGLAKAVERFEPDRNLKLSTYATYYITNEVRRCFQAAATGCLRVPPNYHDIRLKYEKLVKAHYYKTGGSLDIGVAAEAMGMQEARLSFILRSTQPLVQLDGPFSVGVGGGIVGAGKAGSVGDESSQTLADSIQDLEPSPEDIVERSLLRQCLENALATELSPHERDVIRLRHGLDDGVSRTVKEVVETCGGMLSQADIRRAEYRAYSKLRIPKSVHNQRLMGFAAEIS